MDDVREASRCGKFGYEIIDQDLILPYIFRGDEKYCATKIFTWYFDQRNIDLSPNLIDFQYLKGYEMHKEEMLLMNDINEWHNNSIYPFKFKSTDTLVKMKDICDIFTYVNDCSQKSKLGNRYQMMAAGIVLIRFTNLNVVWPYVIRNGIRYIPANDLHVKGILKATATLADVEVMYMTFLLNHLKMDIPADNSQMPCVMLAEALAHLKSVFGDVHDFVENYWPTEETSPKKVINNNWPYFKIKQKTNAEEINSQQPKTKKQDTQKTSDIKAAPTRKRRLSKPIVKVKKPKPVSGFFEVDYLIDYKKQKNGKEFVLVHWKGYSSQDDTWEPISNLNEGLLDDVDALRSKRTKK